MSEPVNKYPGTCRRCGRESLQVSLCTEGVHHAKVFCTDCGAFDRWLPKPEGDKAKRPAAHRDLVERFGRGFCEICGRTKAELAKGETFHGHHVEEHALGGEPTKANVRIYCTACHAMVHWLRSHLGKRVSP